jgi:hypothetical protein
MPIKLSLAEDIIDRLLIFVGLTSRAPNITGSSPTPVLPRALIEGANRSMVVGPVALHYKKRKGSGARMPRFIVTYLPLRHYR